MQKRDILLINTADLVPFEKNARTHSKKQIRQIAESIKKFTFVAPILVDAQNGIIAGHGRVMAAKLLGLREVPCIRVDHLSDAEKRAYIIADNKLAANADWDEDILAQEFKELLTLDLDFDLEITGFHTAEIDFLIDQHFSLETATGEDPDALPEEPVGPAIAQLGDLWQLDTHFILCGNALEQSSYDTLMQGEKAQMLLSDPPYNVPIDGHVTGNGKIRHREFAMASGEMLPAEFIKFLELAFSLARDYSMNGSLHYIFMDWRHVHELVTAGQNVYTEFKNLCVWVKDNAGMGSFYRSRHELIFIFKNGIDCHINNIELGAHGRYRSNVWEYAGANSFSRKQGLGQNDLTSPLSMHPTVKPVLLLEDAIKDCTRLNDLVLDPFLGSGSTLIAAEKSGRRCYGIEIDPVYVDTAIRRWEWHTGQRAQRISAGSKGGQK